MRNSVYQEEPDEVLSYQDPLMAGHTQIPAQNGFNDEISADPFAALNDMPFLELLSRANSRTMPLMDVATAGFRNHSDAEEDRSESWSAKLMPAADGEATRGSIQWPGSSGTSPMTQGANRYPMMWDNGFNTSEGAVAENNFDLRNSSVAPTTPQRDRKNVSEDLLSTGDGSRKHNINSTTVKEGEPDPNDRECSEVGFSFISSTDFKEIKSPEQGSTEVTNLKTPQQRPKKRKHRPKVVQQGESKRTPKQATPKPKNPTPKKKYVKRKGINEQASDGKQASQENDDQDQHYQTKRRSRRALNFDLEDYPGGRIGNSCRLDLNLDLNDQTQEISSFKPYLNVNSVWHEQRDQSRSFEKTKQISTTTIKTPQSGKLKGGQQACFQMNREVDGALETVYKSSTSGETKKMHKQATPQTKSSRVKRKYVRRKGIDVQTSKHKKVAGVGRENSSTAPTLDLDDQQQNDSCKPHLNVNSVFHQYSFSSSKDQSYSVEQYRQGNTATYKDSQPGLRYLNVDTDFASLDDKESAKLQEYCSTYDDAYHNTMDLLKAEYNFLQAQEVEVADSSGIIPCMSFSESHMEIYKKKRTVMEHNSVASGTLSPEETARDIVQETIQGILFDASFSTLLASFIPDIQSNVEAHASLQEAQFTTHQRLQEDFLVPLGMQIQNISNTPAQVCDLSSLVMIEKSETPPSFLANPAPGTVGSGQEDDISRSLVTYTEALVAKEKARLARRKRAERMKISRSKSSAPKRASRDYSLSVDVLTERLKLLDISRQDLISYEECNALVPYGPRYQEQNKLVLYERDGAVVPLDDSLSMLKRRHARPRVDLDEETNRVWNLLLENIDNQGVNGTDEEKVKWWEEERSVFQGRASSFIARMRLVQGDRRFSQWKGSVVDSVAGVFLTQNVSDHLSSSAFISLAAHFPLKQSSSNQEWQEDMASVLEVEPEVPKKSDSGQKQEETINNNESWDSSTGSLSSSELSELNLDYCGSALSATPGKSFTRLKPKTRSEHITEETNRPLPDGVSSQGSVVFSEGSPDTSCTNSADQVRPTTEASIDAQDPTNEPSRSFNGSSISFMGLLQMAGDLVYCENRTHRGESMEPNLNLEGFQIQAENMLADRLAFYDSESVLAESNIPSSNHWMNEIEDVQSGLVAAPMEGESLNKAQEDEGKKGTGRQIFRGQIDIEKDTANESNKENVATSNDKKRRTEKDMDHAFDWDSLRKQVQEKNGKRERPSSTRDSLDWEAVRCADVKEIAKVIKARGMNNRLAERIKDFLNRLVRDHGSIDLEWLKDVPPDKAKEYLLSIRGLGLKSTECVRLLTLQHLAFPVDTNVGRIAVRLGWVPLQPLPESLQLHLLEQYPVMESIQKYLWPRLCKLDQLTLYELHYQMITFGKVFCTKSKPNCNACPMRGECRHFASAFTSSRLALPGPPEKSMVIATQNREAEQNNIAISNPLELPSPSDDHQGQINKQQQTEEPSGAQSGNTNCYPIIEEPKTPEPECTQVLDSDIEDAGWEDPDEIPTIRLDIEEFSQNLQNYMQRSMDLQEGNVSKALVALTSEVASIPTPKLKNMSQLRTEHQVYELPDSHPLLKELDNREVDDPCSYLLAIWTPGETETSIQPPENKCGAQEAGQMCQETTCFACSSVREANSQTVRGTLLIPCRTAMRGSFPLNGTYFQVNEVFADHASSLKPIDVPRDWIWNLPRRTVYFGTSIPTIFKGLSTEEIQHCFWRGYVCVRGFDRKMRAPRPLLARLHYPASKMKKKGNNTNNDGQKAGPL